VHTWLVSITCGDSASSAGTIACNPDNYHLKLVPWVGVACRLPPPPSQRALAPVKGRAFCFLPLPAETGLPVHVNGYFELSSNRRDIWRGDDLAGEGRTRAQWNKALLEGVVAPTYARLLARLAKTVSPESLGWYYSMWPSADIAQPWLSLAQRVLTEAHALPVLYSTAGKGQWVAPQDALYVDASHKGADRVCEALLADGTLLVHVPQEVRDMFEQIGLGLFKAGPQWVRAHLTAAPASAAWRTLSQPVRRETHLGLLEYCLADLRPDARPGLSACCLLLAASCQRRCCCSLAAGRRCRCRCHCLQLSLLLCDCRCLLTVRCRCLCRCLCHCV